VTNDQHYQLPPPSSRSRHAPRPPRLINSTVGWPVRATGIRLKTLNRHAHLGTRRPAAQGRGSTSRPPSRPRVTGLVHAGIVPDNTPDLIHKVMPVIPPPPTPRGLWPDVEVRMR
jgi:hypothetical protein